ncbi:MAG: hypothetical protein ACP5HU_00555 [Phycisphaerae bacterium]
MNRSLTIAAAVAVVLCAAVVVQAGRFDQYTRKYQEPPNPVNLRTASLLGGPGTEWISAAAVLSDGTVVAGGTALGPVLEVAGSEVTAVLGTDSAEPVGFEGDDTPRWDAEGGTGFVVWLSPDYQNVARAVRLPWRAGGVTDMVAGEDGAVYITGKTGETFDSLGEAEDITPSDSVAEGETWGYVARLNRSGDRIEWIKRFRDAYKGPRLRMRSDGNLFVEAADFFVLAPDGRVVQAVEGRRTKSWYRAVDPDDLTLALGYDRNTRTGREPWRQPTLSIVGSDGELRFDLYQWDPKLVGTDQYRLVSDSSFRRNTMYFADDGTLWAVGWSDGGNTVLERQPRDLDEKVPFGGLGFSSWGAGVLSLSHIIQLDPETGEVLNKTLWCAFLPNPDRDKPNSARVNVLQTAADGSVLMAGSSAAGLIQTGDNLLGEGTPGGNYVAILEEDLSDIRFSSALPATAEVLLRDNAAGGEKWAIATGVVNGRAMGVFVCGAVAEKGAYTEPRPAPTRNAVQEDFGGGATDGYLMIFDLGEAE